MTTYSINSFTIAGGQAAYTINFAGDTPGYIEEDHVKYYIENVIQDDSLRTVVGTTVTINPVPVDGTLISFRRETSPTTALVDWVAGEGVTEADLDLNTLQMLYLAQESSDRGAIDTAIAEAAEAKAEQWAEEPEDSEVETGKYSALHHAAKAEDHAATSASHANSAYDYSQWAGTSETNAAASASSASTSETNAALSASNALQSENNAESSAVSAESHKTNAALSETAAELAATNAGISETNAAASAASAGAYMVNAGISAAASAASAVEAAEASTVNLGTDPGNALEVQGVVSGSDIVSNGGFDTDTTNWGGFNGTIASIIGGQSGNCCEVTKTSSSTVVFQQTLSLTGGQAYKGTCYIKAGTLSNPTFSLFVESWDVSTFLGRVEKIPTSSWVLIEFYFVSDTSGGVPIKFTASSTGTGTMLVDTIVCVPVDASLPAIDASDLLKVNLKDYSVTTQALGSITAGTDLDLESGNAITATIGANLTFTFSNPPATGSTGFLLLELTNGGAYTLTFPGTVVWDNGVPTLQASGTDTLLFYTNDAGTTWRGKHVWRGV